MVETHPNLPRRPAVSPTEIMTMKIHIITAARSAVRRAVDQWLGLEFMAELAARIRRGHSVREVLNHMAVTAPWPVRRRVKAFLAENPPISLADAIALKNIRWPDAETIKVLGK
jgi:hypothetical protein